MIKVYIDGLCEPMNPGGVATYGLIIYKDGSIIQKDKGVVGEGPGMSNNVAEYTALCKALSWLTPRYPKESITVLSDSRLVVNQMSDQWKARKGLYLEYYKKALKLKESFPKLVLKWVPREENAEADELTRAAYEQYKARG
jgi:ribonuclease HI